VKGKGASGSFVVVSNAGKTVQKARDRKVRWSALSATLKHMHLMKCSLTPTQTISLYLLYLSSPSTVIKRSVSLKSESES